jgi:hypothetical protein
MFAAVMVRLILSTQPLVFHSDEIWQYLEPAYGLMTGHSIKTWEFDAGIRGWFIPLLLYPPMALGHWLAPEGPLHLILVRLFLGLLSLGVPLAFYDLARSISKRHALVAAWVGAIWPEVFYFGLRSSGEGLALSILFPAIAFCARSRRYDRPAFPFLAGLLLALGAVVRFQYAPAIAVLGLWACWGRGWRHLGWLVAGGASGLAVGALADLIVGQTPYLWVVQNVATNVLESRSAYFGTQPPYWFLENILLTWGAASLLLVPMAILGARRLPILMLVAVVVLVQHSLIPHKEYRFILLGIDTLVLLAAVGSLDVLDWLARKTDGPERWSTGIARVAWCALAVVAAFSPAFSSYWVRGNDIYTMLALAGSEPNLCGLATYEMTNPPHLSYALVNRPVQMVMLDGPLAKMQAAANQAKFNVVLAPRAAAVSLPSAYHTRRCYSQVDDQTANQRMCLYVRPGGCLKGPGDFDYETALRRRGH